MVNWLVPTLERKEDEIHNGYSIDEGTPGPWHSCRCSLVNKTLIDSDPPNAF